MTQTEKLLIVRAGQPVNMSCHQNSNDNYVALWYQQKPSQALQIIVFSSASDTGDLEPDYKNWLFQRPSLLWSSLSKARAEPQDSALYFCAASRHSCKPQSNCLHKTCRSTPKRSQTSYRPLRGAVNHNADVSHHYVYIYHRNHEPVCRREIDRKSYR